MKRCVAFFMLVALLPLVVLLSAFNPADGAPIPYSPFGNLRLPDCSIESIANLTLHEFPGTHITTNEVVRSWRSENGQPFNALAFAMTTGFGGHTINNYILVTTKAQVIAGVANGGVWSSLNDGTHAVAVIGADRRYITIVDDGIIEHWTWSNFFYWQGTPATMYALTWTSS